MKKSLSVVVLALSALSFGVLAQGGHSDKMSGTAMNAMQTEMSHSMDNMHKNMAKSLSEQDADIAFAKGMIAHHQGAIDMAKVELKYGKDPEMKKLAEAIIAAQGPEINQMETWLKAHKAGK